MDINEIESLLAKATKLPWRTAEDTGARWNIEDAHGESVALAGQIIGDPIVGQPERTANARLIVAAVNALPDLLREVKALREALARVEALAKDFERRANGAAESCEPGCCSSAIQEARWQGRSAVWTRAADLLRIVLAPAPTPAPANRNPAKAKEE